MKENIMISDIVELIPPLQYQRVSKKYQVLALNDDRSKAWCYRLGSLSNGEWIPAMHLDLVEAGTHRRAS